MPFMLRHGVYSLTASFFPAQSIKTVKSSLAAASMPNLSDTARYGSYRRSPTPKAVTGPSGASPDRLTNGRYGSNVYRSTRQRHTHEDLYISITDNIGNVSVHHEHYYSHEGHIDRIMHYNTAISTPSCCTNKQKARQMNSHLPGFI